MFTKIATEGGGGGEGVETGHTSVMEVQYPGEEERWGC